MKSAGLDFGGIHEFIEFQFRCGLCGEHGDRTQDWVAANADMMHHLAQHTERQWVRLGAQPDSY